MTRRDDVPSGKPRLDKLGVKPNQRVAVLNVDDESFLDELYERTDAVSVQRRRVGCDLIFVGFPNREELRRLGPHKDFIKPDGAVWAIWPKGSKEINENDVRAAALATGLVDVKVVSFSPRLSALKLVIPLERRTKLGE